MIPAMGESVEEGEGHSAIEPDPLWAAQLTDLAGRITKGECVLFLGAYTHAPPPAGSPYLYPPELRPPLTGELTRGLINKFNLQSHPNFPAEWSQDLQRVSLFIEKSPGLGRSRLIDGLDDLVRKGKEPSPALEMLSQLPWRIIVTTNYDTLVERALRKFGKDPVVRCYEPEIDRPARDILNDPTPDAPLVFKMHGDFDSRESIVITDEDYIQFVQRMIADEKTHPVPRTVRHRMTKWPTLFIGYSLRDFNLRLIFRTLRWHLDPADFPRSFSVDPRPDPLIVKVYQDERSYVAFVAEDLWSVVPWLYKTCGPPKNDG